MSATPAPSTMVRNGARLTAYNRAFSDHDRAARQILARLGEAHDANIRMEGEGLSSHTKHAEGQNKNIGEGIQPPAEPARSGETGYTKPICK